MSATWAGLVVLVFFTRVRCHPSSPNASHRACDLVHQITSNPLFSTGDTHENIPLAVCLATYDVEKVVFKPPDTEFLNCTDTSCLLKFVFLANLSLQMCRPPHVEYVSCKINDTSTIDVPFPRKDAGAEHFSLIRLWSILKSTKRLDETESAINEVDRFPEPTANINKSESMNSSETKTIWTCRTTTVWVAVIAVLLVVVIYIGKYVDGLRNHRIPRLTLNDRVSSNQA